MGGEGSRTQDAAAWGPSLWSKTDRCEVTGAKSTMESLA